MTCLTLGLLGENFSQRSTISIMHNHKSQTNIILQKGTIENNEKLSATYSFPILP